MKGSKLLRKYAKPKSIQFSKGSKTISPPITRSSNKSNVSALYFS